MGSMITLSLGGIDIDWGKNRNWEHHHWLFPTSSLTTIDYRYVDDTGKDVVESRPGFETTLDDTLFRLRHLGYSAHETEAKFNAALARWNRRHDLQLSYDDFRRALTSIDFSSDTHAAVESSFGYDFWSYIRSLLEPWDTEDVLLEGFLEELDIAIVLRTLADRPENRALPLRWHHHDLIEGGWATLDDLTEIDSQQWTINHTMLVGRLQDHAGAQTVTAFDTWLAGQGLPQATRYVKVKPDGTFAHQMLTLPSAVRNMIHHPENPHNVLTDHDLRASVEVLLVVARGLTTPIPALV